MRSVTSRKAIKLLLAVIAGFVLNMLLRMVIDEDTRYMHLAGESADRMLLRRQISSNMSLEELKYHLLRLPDASTFLHAVLNATGQTSDHEAGGQTSDHHDSDQTSAHQARRHQDDRALHKDDTREADTLYRDVRVLCWVMTSPDNLDKRCVYIQQTWGRRCNKLLFFSSVDNATFPAIGVGTGEEGRNHLMSKQSRAFQYVYTHYYNDYDWFLKTDDDAYVIMENLRYFLSSRDTNQPVYFGHHFKVIAKGGYFSGGPGIVLGKLALKRFAEVYENTTQCRQDGAASDAALSQCLYKVGVYAGNSTDVLGRSRFHCFNPGTHVKGGFPSWYYKYDANGAHHGVFSMSDYAIGFHYVSGVKTLELEYLIYHLRPYGVKYGLQDLNQPWKKGNITIQPLF